MGIDQGEDPGGDQVAESGMGVEGEHPFKGEEDEEQSNDEDVQQGKTGDEDEPRGQAPSSTGTNPAGEAKVKANQITGGREKEGEDENKNSQGPMPVLKHLPEGGKKRHGVGFRYQGDEEGVGPEVDGEDGLADRQKEAVQGGQRGTRDQKTDQAFHFP